jgi:hypothetical protein
MEADATVLFTQQKLTPGTRMTRQMLEAACKPWMHIETRYRGVQLAETYGRKLAVWLGDRHTIRTLNIAGSRESKAPGIQAEVKAILMEALRA